MPVMEHFKEIQLHLAVVPDFVYGRPTLKKAGEFKDVKSK